MFGKIIEAVLTPVADAYWSVHDFVEEKPVETAVTVAAIATGALIAGPAAPAIAKVIASTGVLGTASTGAKIATLAGAALEKAALAKVGGGALSAGGAGIAGGKAVITTAGGLASGVVAGQVQKS